MIPVIGILRCDWGKRVMLSRDEEHCPLQATSRVVVHTPDGQRLLQLCDGHRVIIDEQTDPHKEPPMPQTNDNAILAAHLKDSHGLEDVSIYTASLETVHREIHRNLETIGENRDPTDG